MKRGKSGLTLVELLTVLAIISLLVGLLIPALSAVKNSAKQAKQTAQLAAIAIGLETFKNDSEIGSNDYPPSDWPFPPAPGSEYCGAQKLAEALLGWDLLGFHPKSAWRADGLDMTDGEWSYDPGRVRGNASFDERRGPFLELGTTNAFRLGELFPRTGTAPLALDTFVICDVFGSINVTLRNGKHVKAGAPILYYRADTSRRTINEIYRARDNDALVFVKERADGPDPDPPLEHPLGDASANYGVFYNCIRDPKISAIPWPYRPDSYILISAGADGLYGTPDDVHNFGN